MPELNLDEIVEMIDPWEYTVRVGGQSYPTRPLTVGDLCFVESIDEGGGGVRVARLVEFAGGLFAGERKPDVGRLTPAKLKALIKGVAEYFAQRAKKNDEVEAARARVVAAERTATARGDGPPPGS